VFVPDSRLLIQGGVVLSIDRAIGDLARGDVLVEDGRIAAVAPALDVTDCDVIDASGFIVMPGFVDTHRHTWQAPVRNIAADWSLFHYLWGLHTGLSRHFRPQDTYAGNLLGTLEALDSGITTMLDWSHNLATPEHADAAIDGLRDSGARAVFAHGGGAPQWGSVPGNTVAHPDDARRIRDTHFSSDDDLVTMALALRGPQFTTEEVSLQDWRLARELDLRITVHVGDGELGKTRPIEWMQRHGLLDDRTTYVHCNTLGDDELKLIADSGGTASVASIVEMQMGHGWPATGRLLEAGIRPSLSIDVCSAIGGDMFSQMRTALLAQRALDNADLEARGISLSGGELLRLSTRDVLEFATIEGARACGLDERTGSITPGKDADLIMIRTDALAMTPLNNPVGALVYNAHPGLVDTVLVRGRIAKRDGALVGHMPARARVVAEQTREHLLLAAAGDAGIADARFDGGWTPRPHVHA
jgi:cytosine/adenosine deaminase-related metal-dependent hydrolase